MTRTSVGLDENVASLLCYVGGWISGVVFWMLEKENQTVRFHALQSMLVFGALNVAILILALVPPIGPVLAYAIGGLAIVCWIIGILTAWRGLKYRFPWAGSFAEKRVG